VADPKHGAVVEGACWEVIELHYCLGKEAFQLIKGGRPRGRLPGAAVAEL